VADIHVYGASWCPDCLRAKKFLTEQRVPFDWFDIERNPRLVRVVEERNDGKHIIPTVVFADGSHLSEPTNEQLADKLGLVRTAAQHLYDLVVVGGGPAGLTTAIYAARENIETLVIEVSGLGGQAGVTHRVENYPGFPDGVGGADLADRFIEQSKRYGVELLQAVGVAGVQRDPDGIVVVETRAGEHYHARAVLVATGSSYRRLLVPGEEELIGAGIHFCATCDGPFYRGASELLVVGGGNSGLEEGLFLTQFAEMVTVVEFNATLKASRLLQDKVMEDPKMRVFANHRVAEFRVAPGPKLAAVVVEDRASGVTRELDPAAVFVFIGLDPNTAFLQGGVQLDREGFVVTDRALTTNVPGVFAAGDVRAGSTKQLASAVGEGAAAALSIRSYLESVR
jgi:thioredoxin reductase (NADPH)